MTRHLFIAPGNALLERWRQAFPDALVVASGQAVDGAPAPSLAWVRLRGDAPVAAQLAEARRRLGSVPVVVLSDRPDDEEALAAFAAAARGYCNSHATPEVLRQVADVVMAGGLWIGESLMSRLISATARLAEPRGEEACAWVARLTEREAEVARAVAAGASNKEVARRLGITERTVKAHLGTAFEKLGVRDRLQLALAINGRAAERV